MGQEGVLNNAAVLRLLSSGGGGGMVGERHPGLQREFQDRPVSKKKSRTSRFKAYVSGNGTGKLDKFLLF